MQTTFMKLAIKEAKKGARQTFTNPLVGAVITQKDQVIAKGAHLQYGEAHAERNAIANCSSSEELIHSTLYVTLEPCHHTGKQPPCTQLILESGIQTVVIGQLDPNPLVAGKGKQFLEANGIEVIVGVAEAEVRELNRFYNFYYQQHRPYVVLKQATTLDGRLALQSNQRTAITGPEVWQMVHEERANYQAILVGSQTVLTDDPQLLPAIIGLYPPVRVVLDRRGRTLTQPNLKLFKDARVPVWIFTEQQPPSALPEHVIVVPFSRLTIEASLMELGKRGIQSVYVEGGAQLHDAFLASDCWEEVLTYIAPKIIGGQSLASFASNRVATVVHELVDPQFQLVGEDIRISGRRASQCLRA